MGASCEVQSGCTSTAKNSFVEEFRVRSGRVIPTVMAEEDGSGYTISSQDAEEYQASVAKAIDQFAYLYNESAEKVAAGQADPIEEEKAIRAHLKQLLEEERLKPTGRRWIPPYGFAAEAEAVEQYLQPDGQQYFPSMVYVGTIIHYDKYLKKQGAESQNYLEPKKDIPADRRDAALDAKIIEALGLVTAPALVAPVDPGSRPDYSECYAISRREQRHRDICFARTRREHNSARREYRRALRDYERALEEQESSPASASDVDVIQALFDRLVEESADNYAWGLNPYEAAAIKAVQYHWRDDFPTDADELLDADVQKLVKAHNAFGIGPILLKRWLVSYWNNPKSVRATLYDVENGGKLFKLSANSAALATISNADAFFSINSELRSDAERKAISENSANDPRDAQPRLDQEIVCGGDRPVDQTVSVQRPNCD
ncbi:MAG: hypothetical protein R2827_16230 [Bdellovibrionales bacterium]